VCDHTTIQNLFDDFDEFDQNEIQLLMDKQDVQQYIDIYSELKKIIDLDSDNVLSLNMNLEYYFKNIEIDIRTFIKIADYLEFCCGGINDIFRCIIKTYSNYTIKKFIKQLLEIDCDLNWKDLEMCFMDINQVSEKHSEIIYNKFMIYLNRMEIDISYQEKRKSKNKAYNNSIILLNTITKHMTNIIKQYHIKKSTSIMLYIYEFINFMEDYKSIYNFVKKFRGAILNEFTNAHGREDITANIIYNLLFDLIVIELDSDISFDMALKQLNSIKKIKIINTI
jgi:hypothetical protein